MKGVVKRNMLLSGSHFPIAIRPGVKLAAFGRFGCRIHFVQADWVWLLFFGACPCRGEGSLRGNSP